MKERRAEGRYLCADLVRLDWLQRDEMVCSEQALLEDISARGACVQTERPVAVGSLAVLTVATTPFYGIVGYCNFRDDGFFIGLRFSADSKWSEGVVRPRHLTSLSDLGLQAAGEKF